MSEAQIQRSVQMEELKTKMHGQSDEFIRDIFSHVIQPVLFRKVLPLVDKVCSDLLAGLTPKGKVSVA